MKIKKIKKEKFDYKRYLGTRKYKLSFSGFGAQIDWIIALFAFIVGFVFIMFFFFSRSNSINSELNKEIILDKQETFDVKQVEKLIEEYFNSNNSQDTLPVILEDSVGLVGDEDASLESKEAETEIQNTVDAIESDTENNTELENI